jgi:hypothetical protein
VFERCGYYRHETQFLIANGGTMREGRPRAGRAATHTMLSVVRTRDHRHALRKRMSSISVAQPGGETAQWAHTNTKNVLQAGLHASNWTGRRSVLATLLPHFYHLFYHYSTLRLPLFSPYSLFLNAPHVALTIICPTYSSTYCKRSGCPIHSSSYSRCCNS